MCIHPELAVRLAREYHRRLLGEAEQQRLQRRCRLSQRPSWARRRGPGEFAWPGLVNGLLAESRAGSHET